MRSIKTGEGLEQLAWGNTNNEGKGCGEGITVARIQDVGWMYHSNITKAQAF